MASIFIGIVNLAIIIFSFALSPRIDAETVKKDYRSGIKAIYVTAYSASDSARFKELVDLVDRTELNAIVIDIKDYTGRVFVRTLATGSKEIGSFKPMIKDLENIVKKLKEKNIYTIARIAVFQDPYLAEKIPNWAAKDSSGNIWHDYKGLSWVDTSKVEVWRYNLEIAEAAAQMGFDEVNFDYIRFPSDGRIKEIEFGFESKGITKNDVMESFFEFIHRGLRYKTVKTSVDLFGMTLWRDDGLGIGQRLQNADGKFDYIYPMVYPSHYPDNFEGYSNPAEYPYEIVYNSLDKGKRFLSGGVTKIMPWIQDFDLGADYDARKVRLQIQAAYDAGSEGWLLWNASNRYTSDALLTE